MPSPRARAVLAVVCGPEVAALARVAGADVVVRDCPPPGTPATDVDETVLTGALAGTGARHVVLLGCDAALAPVAERAAAGARRAGQEVVVVPTASVVAGLAALAVHDPERHAADDIVAMTRPRRAPGRGRCWSPTPPRSPGPARARPATCSDWSTARWC
jgi:dihydroxyacetone kinase-like predicted kinase